MFLFKELFDFIEKLFLWGLALIAVIIAVNIIRGRLRRRKQRKAKEKATSGHVKSARATGCKSSMSCQYMDLGKAKKEGKPDTVCFCRSVDAYVTRTDNCARFLPRGCQNGICHYAKHTDSSCYCKYYNKHLASKDSCPYYLDFFDTPEGEAFRNTVVRE